MKGIIEKWNSISLVKRILCGLVIGAILGVVAKQATVIGLLGELFVGALKAVAPVLVFFLVMGSLAQHKDGQKSNMGTVIGLYLIATFAAALVAVVGSFIFPVTVNLGAAAAAEGAAAAQAVLCGPRTGIFHSQYRQARGLPRTHQARRTLPGYRQRFADAFR